MEIGQLSSSLTCGRPRLDIFGRTFNFYLAFTEGTCHLRTNGESFQSRAMAKKESSVKGSQEEKNFYFIILLLCRDWEIKERGNETGK